MDSTLLVEAIAFFKRLPPGTEQVDIRLSDSTVTLTRGTGEEEVDVKILPHGHERCAHIPGATTIPIPGVRVFRVEGGPTTPPSVNVGTET